VGSIDSDGKRSSFSNYGAESVDLFAPGSRIASTLPYGKCNNGSCLLCRYGEQYIADGYHTDSGTSMAAPYVAGVAALVKSLHPEMTGKELKTALRASVDPLYQSGLCSTNGKINAYKAVTHIPIVGSMNIHFNGSINGRPQLKTVQGTTVGKIHIGKFHLFTNNTWTIAEMGGALSYPIKDFEALDIPYYVEWESVPAPITKYLRLVGIGRIYPMFVHVYAPLSNYYGVNYWNHSVISEITSTYSSVDNYGFRFYMNESNLPANNQQRKIKIENSYGTLY
jgi:hypothetical protein